MTNTKQSFLMAIKLKNSIDVQYTFSSSLNITTRVLSLDGYSIQTGNLKFPASDSMENLMIEYLSYWWRSSYCKDPLLRYKTNNKFQILKFLLWFQRVVDRHSFKVGSHCGGNVISIEVWGICIEIGWVGMDISLGYYISRLKSSFH